jgi:hypothetical protein
MNHKKHGMVLEEFRFFLDSYGIPPWLPQSVHLLLCEKPKAGKQLKMDDFLKNSQPPGLPKPLVKVNHQL